LDVKGTWLPHARTCHTGRRTRFSYQSAEDFVRLTSSKHQFHSSSYQPQEGSIPSLAISQISKNQTTSERHPNETPFKQLITTLPPYYTNLHLPILQHNMWIPPHVLRGHWLLGGVSRSSMHPVQYKSCRLDTRCQHGRRQNTFRAPLVDTTLPYGSATEGEFVE